MFVDAIILDSEGSAMTDNEQRNEIECNSDACPPMRVTYASSGHAPSLGVG
jgi:hypothetical protein